MPASQSLRTAFATGGAGDHGTIGYAFDARAVRAEEGIELRRFSGEQWGEIIATWELDVAWERVSQEELLDLRGELFAPLLCAVQFARELGDHPAHRNRAGHDDGLGLECRGDDLGEHLRDARGALPDRPRNTAATRRGQRLEASGSGRAGPARRDSGPWGAQYPFQGRGEARESVAQPVREPRGVSSEVGAALTALTELRLNDNSLTGTVGP